MISSLSVRDTQTFTPHASISHPVVLFPSQSGTGISERNGMLCTLRRQSRLQGLDMAIRVFMLP
jgi:hypothetical protein